MSSRKFIVKNRRKRKILFSILFVMLFMITVGYSTLSTILHIGGNLEIAKGKCQVNGKLYNVLKCAVEDGLALEYTGAHQDSMDASKSTEKIYHWYAPSGTTGDTLANQILQKNNVIFAGQCWQMIRTTDTGGVKMIYNGEAENNQCLNTRGKHVGYEHRTSQSLTLNYFYGTDYIYDSTNKVFKVSGTTEQATWNATTGPSLIGKYTCRRTNVDATCATLYLVESYYDTSSAYVIPLNSDSYYSQFGILRFNADNLSPSDGGYMYNTRYTSNYLDNLSYEYLLSFSTLSTTYWYAHDVVWGSPIVNSYNLDNPYQVSATNDYPNLAGEYTFRNATQTNTDTKVFYIAAVNGTTMYYIQLGNEAGTSHNLSYYNYTYTYGDSYTDNGDGTYTINNPTTFNRSDWYAIYRSVGAHKYVCKNAVNDTCSDLWYTTAVSNMSMTYIKVANNYKYAKSFTWDGSKYVLDNDTSVIFWNTSDSTNINILNNAHYTCWNTTGECTTLSYIYRVTDAIPFYINLTNGKSIEEAKNEMLYDDNVNTINSIIKSGVDAWYKHYLLENYDEYIEDTIYCNDRSQSNARENGWNPNGGDVTKNMEFYGLVDLSCPNDTDKFSVSNSKANLTYKVGLMSYREMILLGNYNIRKTGNYYHLGSPFFFSHNVAHMRQVTNQGSLQDLLGSSDCGVRPAVSLKPGIEFSDGDGSMLNPYYLGDIYTITSNSDIFNIKEKSPPGLEVKLESDDYIVTSFRLNGTLVEGDSFVMPEENVTITDIQYVVANYTITNNDNSVTVPSVGRYRSTITLEAEGYKIISFKLNGTLIEGNSFAMPAENVVITDITKIAQVTVESDHNPYANNINNVTYYENTFDGATSLTVEFTYQTESTTYDWIYLYDTNGSTTPFNNKKYGGTTLKTETLTINSNYLKIVFRTDSGSNNFYGFKAVITPNY